MNLPETAIETHPAARLETLPAHGVWSPAITPLRPDLSIDRERYVEHARWLLAKGCHGLTVFGTTGEANSFSVEERMALLEALLAAGIDPGRLMVGTGCCALTDSLTLSRHAMENGCQQLLMLPPFYYKGVSDEGLFGSFARIIDGVGDPDLRLFFYHFPRLSGVPITTGLIDRTRAAYPDIVAGVKDSSGDREHTLALIGRYPELAIFPGAETLLLAGLRTGGAGCITASANVNVAAIRRLYEAWCGSGEDADALDDSVRAIRAAMESHPMVPALKCVAAHFRGDPEWATVRPPMVALTSEQRADLLSKLEAAGFESSSLNL